VAHAYRGLAALATAGLLAAGCGGNSSNGGDETVKEAAPKTSKDTGLAGKVPAAIRSDGKIIVGTDATYAPSEFLAPDGKTIIGFDVDLFRAVAQKLGLQAQFRAAPFDAIITGVGSGKYEIGVSSFTVNAQRKQQVNMVSYFSAGTQWATKKGNPTGISIDNACGKRVAVQKATVQVDDVAARSKKCTAAGKPAISVDQYQGQDQATSAVVSGKDDAMLADSPVVAYAVKQSGGALETLGEIYDAAPYGYVVKKDQTEFAKAIADAVKQLIAEGSYRSALAKWGVTQGAITDPAVNP
jgi:polar amino acid transport system substrate-binding protein